MKILLVGGGWIAETIYIPFLSEIESINSIDVLDPNYQTLTQRFQSYPKVTVMAEIDATVIKYDFIFILSPNHMHFIHLKKYMHLNTTIMVEKPICINSDEANELQTLLAKTSTVIHVSAPLRYRSDMNAVKDILTENTLGTIYHTEMSWLKRRGTPGSAWFTKKDYAGGGVLIDMGPHILDLYFWLLGSQKLHSSLGSLSSHFLQAKDAYADWHSGERMDDKTDVEDNSFSLLTFHNRSLAMKLAWASNIENDYVQIKLFGTRGTLDVLTSIGFSTNTLYKDTTLNLTVDGKTTTQVLSIEERKEPFRKMIKNVILKRSLEIPNNQTALQVVNTIFNLYQSSEKI